jgi:radical SAM-linked protein
VTKTYLAKALASARNLAEVTDCVIAPCSVCGACDYEVVKNRVYEAKDYVPEPARPPPPPESPLRTHVRVRYAKRGRLVALSHLETMHAILRAIRRAGLPVAYSQGFHPKPRVAFGPALPVGVESEAEYLDLELVGAQDAAEIAARLAARLPEDLQLVEARPLDPRAPSISAATRAAHYLADFPEAWTADALRSRIEAFGATERVVVRRQAPPRPNGGRRRESVAQPKARETDVKDVVTHLALEGERRVAFSLRADPSGSAKPAEVLAVIFGDGAPPRGVKVLKEGVSFARNAAIRQHPAPPPRDLDA